MDSLDARRGHHVAWLALCFLFATAGILSAVLLLVEPPDPGRSVWLWSLTGTSLALAMVGVRLELHADWLLEALLLLGTAMVTGAVLLTGDGPSPWIYFYAWLGVEAALLLAVRPAIRVNIAGALAATAAVVFSPADDWDTYVMSMGSMLVIGVLAWVLRLRVDRLAVRLHETAQIDPLTGLLSRSGLQEALTSELDRARHEGRELGVLVGGLDRLGELNERHGHQEGDRTLVAFSEACGVVQRGGDIAGRIGGKAFALILPATSPEAALRIADRLMATVASRLGDSPGSPTISVGVAAYPTHARTAETLLHAAEQAQLIAKEEGRNRVVIYTSEAADKLRIRRAAPREATEQLDAVLLLAETLDLRDPSTARHSHTVAAYAERTARHLGLADRRVVRIRLAGLLHDIGKLGVPDAILHKPGRLTPEEFEEIKRHPGIGARILDSAGLPDLSAWVLAHHERPDGRGYPSGMTLGDIPVEARILAVADAYEAMTAERVYSTAMPADEAREELRRNVGTQFDPAVVDAFLVANR